MLIDTHAHVNFKGFAEDAENTIQRALDAGVSVVNVGTHISTSRQAVEMAEKFQQFAINNSQLTSKVYAVVGIHPVHTYSQDLQEEETQFKTRAEKFNYEEYKKLAQNPLVVGIGECGLDYFRLPDSKQQTVHSTEEIKQMQKEAFIEQIKLALELDKALVIHTRATKGTDDACLDVLDILKMPSLWNHSESRVHPSDEESLSNKNMISSTSNQSSLPRFVLHSYTSSPETAQKFIQLGAYISFNGILTFDKTGNQEAVLKLTPNDRILLETDCPFLTPVPHRGKKNEPLFVKHVAEKVAEIKDLTVDMVSEITTTNAKNFYKI